MAAVIAFVAMPYTWNPLATHTAQQGLGAGTLTSDWDILQHLGGNGPWIQKTSNVVPGGIAVPEGCIVEQVHMMSRHAERYPTKRVAKAQKSVVNRMKQSGKTFTGNLSFFNDWNLFWTKDTDLEELTESGIITAFTMGVRLRTRYKHLISRASVLRPNIRTTVWATDCPRVKDTASNFILGFWGADHVKNPRPYLEIVSEDPRAGADTLTPGRTCLANGLDENNGKANGYRFMSQYRATYLPPVRKRLYGQTGIDFSDAEIYAMQEMCGFEILVRGNSSWCDVFTRDEFLAFEYARDVLHYYRAGPGNKYAASMGWLWLNATKSLLLEGEEGGTLFFSFVHDGDITPMVTALDIMNEDEQDGHLPITKIRHNRKWRKSQVCPMGGRIIFELLSCRTKNRVEPEKFVRVNINDGITAIPDCKSGPGLSCPLEHFAARTEKKGLEAGDFNQLCQLGAKDNEKITFLRHRYGF